MNPCSSSVGSESYLGADVCSRFWHKVAKTGPAECWEWKACVAQNGYGMFGVRGKTRLAHRVSWEIANGGIPQGLCVLHRCDNKRCVNPEHLFLGTSADNMEDCYFKGRIATGKAHGAYTHPERVLKGEKHGMAKLNNWSAVGILARCLQGAAQRKVAGEFGLTQRTVMNIWNGTNWRHLFVAEGV